MTGRELRVGDTAYITGDSGEQSHGFRIGRKVYIFHDEFESDGTYGVSAFPYYDEHSFVSADDLGSEPPEADDIIIGVETGMYLPD